MGGWSSIPFCLQKLAKFPKKFLRLASLFKCKTSGGGIPFVYHAACIKSLRLVSTSDRVGVVSRVARALMTY